jgi:hypothetical protein
VTTNATTGVLALAVILSYLLGVPERGVDGTVPDALSVLGGWDTSWYLDIARRGYDDYTGLVGVFFTNLAFFPLLPVVMKVGIALGLNPFLFAVVIGNAAFLVALVLLHRLTLERFGPRVATLTTWGVALSPPAVYASMAYTEGLVMGLALGATLLAHRRRFAWAGAVAAAAALARPPGILVAVLVAAIALTGAGERPERIRRALLGAAPAAVALIAFLVWMQLTRGSWGLPFAAQGAWERAPLVVGLFTNLPGELVDIAGAFADPTGSPAWTAALRDVGFTVVYVLLLVRLWRMEGGLRSPWVLYTVGTLALPLSSGSFISMARFGLMAFPLWWAGATWAQEEGDGRRRRVLAVAGAVLSALAVLQLAYRSP